MSNPGSLKKKPIDPINIQICVTSLPLEQIKKTLECPTQLVHWTVMASMQQHWKARFRFLNMYRLREAVARDIFFATCKTLGGYTCDQVFLGIKSRMIHIYPMNQESEGPQVYEDFIMEKGCTKLLRRDNSKIGEEFRYTNRYFCIKDAYTESCHPNQNPAENQAVT